VLYLGPAASGALLLKDGALRGAVGNIFRALAHAATSAARDAAGADTLAASAQAGRAAMLARLAVGADAEHVRMLQRKLVIERRKEELERHVQAQQLAARERAAADAADAALQERTRLQAEARRRDSARTERERAEEEDVSKRRLAEALAAQRLALKKTMKKSGWDIETDVDKLATMSTQKLVAEQSELIRDERAEFEKRLETLRKRADYLERARREAEAPLLRTHREYSLRADRESHARAVARFIEASQAARKDALEQQARLLKVVADKVRERASTRARTRARAVIRCRAPRVRDRAGAASVRRAAHGGCQC
jgi:translation initiation factor 3 subunit A